MENIVRQLNELKTSIENVFQNSLILKGFAFSSYLIYSKNAVNQAVNKINSLTKEIKSKTFRDSSVDVIPYIKELIENNFYFDKEYIFPGIKIES